MIESFVDLTYRGLSLGRRIRLSQVRPRSGYLELPAPMPVGTELSITTDDGTAFDATVTAVREQVAGAEHAPGMTVAPALTSDAVAAWWAARVSLPDDAPRPRTVIGGRNRPVTVRPRSHAERAADPPPLERARTDEVPTIAGEVDERVAAAAGAEARGRPVYGDGIEARTILTPAIELPAEAPAGDAGSEPGEGPGERPGEAIDPNPGRTLEVPVMAPMAPPMRRTGEHEVVDDGNRTVLMESVDPATLGLDLGAAGGTGGTGGEGESLDDDEAEVTDPGDPGPGPSESPTVPDGTFQPGGRRKRKLRR